MIAVNRMKEGEMGTNPNSFPKVTKGKSIVTLTTANVANNKYLLGLLLNNCPCVRITNTISEAERTDSKNQPVLN